MGQIEVYDFLKNKRVSGCEKFYSARDIYNGLREANINGSNMVRMWASVSSLESSGYLDVRLESRFKHPVRKFRLKKKYCEEMKV